MLHQFRTDHKAAGAFEFGLMITGHGLTDFIQSIVICRLQRLALLRGSCLVLDKICLRRVRNKC